MAGVVRLACNCVHLGHTTFYALKVVTVIHSVWFNLPFKKEKGASEKFGVLPTVLEPLDSETSTVGSAVMTDKSDNLDLCRALTVRWAQLEGFVLCHLI